MKNNNRKIDILSSSIIVALCFLLVFPFPLLADTKVANTKTTNQPVPPLPANHPNEIATTEKSVAPRDSILGIDTIPVILSPADIIKKDSLYMAKDSSLLASTEKVRIFNPDPTRAVWLSALFPGLGQIYNRRFWKLPIVVGGFMGISYAMTWNNKMLRDYTKAYRDVMDNDPNTNSYMDFYPPTVDESSIDKEWLKKVLKSKKDFYRRNRDLSIICMVGMYFLCMVDAYVDASLSHFDISPDLSMDVYPILIEQNRNSLPSIGVQWAVRF